MQGAGVSYRQGLCVMSKYKARGLGWLLAGALALPLMGSAETGGATPGVDVARWKNAGPYEVAVFDEVFRDASREREILVRVYRPAGAPGARPVVVFSHGLGGSREGYAYLGRHWASHGFVCVHPQHAGSDVGVWQGGDASVLASLRAAAALPQNAADRPRDVAFVLDRLEQWNRTAGHTLEATLDFARVGVAGHSFGAHTTLVCAGAKMMGPDGAFLQLREPRMKAGLALSPTVAKQRDRLDEIYGGVGAPLLHMTCTGDESPIGGTSARERRLPFDHIRAPGQVLVILEGGSHMAFGDRRPSRPDRVAFHDRILISTTAFWEAMLCDDAAARAFLKKDGLGTAMGPEAVVEFKGFAP